MGKRLWEQGYFTASTGNVTGEIIAEYIEKQSQIAPEDDEQGFSMDEL